MKITIWSLIIFLSLIGTGTGLSQEFSASQEFTQAHHFQQVMKALPQVPMQERVKLQHRFQQRMAQIPANLPKCERDLLQWRLQQDMVLQLRQMKRNQQ